MRCPGTFLLPYADQLIRVLDRALLLKAREGYEFAGGILGNCLRSLTSIYPTDYRYYVSSVQPSGVLFF